MSDTSTPVEEKNKGGRPLKFESVAELNAQIESYFNKQDPHSEERRVEDGVNLKGETIWTMREVMTDQRPYTIMGLAYHLRTSRDTLLDYESGMHDEKADDFDETGERFSDAIKLAKARINMQVEERMLSGEAPSTPSIFWLKNNAKWQDRQEIDHTTGGEPMKALVEFIGGSTEPSQD